MKPPQTTKLLVCLSSALLLASSHLTLAAPAGLVAFWSADGTTADSVSTNNGTIHGNVVYATGYKGQAFDFTPTSRVIIPDSPSFRNPSFTLSGWVNPDVWGGHLLYRGDGRGGLDNYVLSLYTPGSLTFTIDTTLNLGLTVGAPLELGKWSHFAATFDNDTGAMKLYINGLLKTNFVTTLRPIITLGTNACVAIGNVELGNDFSFNGRVDEIGIYSRALTASEIVELYNLTPLPDQISLWSANGNTVDSISGHDGFIVGNVTYAPGVLGQAFDFVPPGSKVRVADDPDYETPSFTVSGWINPRTYAGHMLVRGDAQPGLDTYIFSLYQPGKIQLIVCSTNNASVSLTAPLQLNRWSHFAGSFDDATGVMKLYVDGQLKATTNTSLRPITVLNVTQVPGIGIGNVGDPNDFSINGTMDEVGIYRKALSDQKIKDLFAAAADSDSDGLIDANEIAFYHTDPTKKDTDGDGLADGSEVNRYLTNPLSADSDSDGYGDYAEIYSGKDPNSATDYPSAELTLYTAVELEFIGKTNTTYYIQCAPDMKTWTNYDGPILGTGNIWSKLYSTKNGGTLYFRVEQAN